MNNQSLKRERRQRVAAGSRAGKPTVIVYRRKAVIVLVIRGAPLPPMKFQAFNDIARL